MPRSWLSAGLFITLLPGVLGKSSFDCNDIADDKQHWNLGKLAGPKEVHWQQKEDHDIRNTTYRIDICAALKDKPELDKKSQCTKGTWICAYEYVYHGEEEGYVERHREIAGQYYINEGRSIDPEIERLKSSSGHEDSKKEGLRITLQGGEYQKKPQKAIIEFICDKDKTGNEGFEDEKSKLETRAIDATAEDDADDEDGGGEDGDDELPDLDEGKSLQFIDYDTTGKTDILRLTWMTNYACEEPRDDLPDETDEPKSKGWGFFTWFIIILFLLIAAYIIFGSWLNYNRYGARGWDLIPHGDTIRDLPYILKDFFGNIVDRLRGGGSRGGYAAV